MKKGKRRSAAAAAPAPPYPPPRLPVSVHTSPRPSPKGPNAMAAQERAEGGSCKNSSKCDPDK
eukprot:7888069-Pyramimonas_sp.AAC.1